eukprot:gnl/Chilomastix_caulleri/3360.p1 GENE.gnl/Chilomastix_caulleri/3360~~gnl/Chilomastix_caulleri/3360.p1  ORF type:complete len:56 (+),score=10.39 gnl/Chilomastix_caulleri/3360:85-252(+)
MMGKKGATLNRASKGGRLGPEEGVILFHKSMFQPYLSFMKRRKKWSMICYDTDLI